MVGEKDFKLALALSILTLRNSRHGTDYPVEKFIQEFIINIKENKQGPKVYKIDEAQLQIYKDTCEVNECTANDYSNITKEHSPVSYSEPPSGTVREGSVREGSIRENSVRELENDLIKPLPKGHSFEKYRKALEDILNIDYDNDFEITNYNVAKDSKLSAIIPHFTIIEVKKLISIFKYFIKYQNNVKNAKILKIIVAIFKKLMVLNSPFLKDAKTIQLLLKEFRLIFIEILKYEYNGFDKFQEFKFKVVISFQSFVINEFLSTNIENGLQFATNYLIKILTDCETFIKIRINRLLLKPECEILADFKDHSFYENYQDALNSKFNFSFLESALMKSLEADIITYDNLYYLIFYEMKLLKIIIDMFIDKKIKLDKSTKIKLVSHGNKRSQKENDKVNPNDSSIYQKIKNYKKRLLSFLLVLNDYELLTLYHEISWDKFMVDDW